jgi:DNA adenine methylase
VIIPPLKWAGGKRWLVNADLLPFPSKIERYVEPFLGSGAVFFHLQPKKAILSDINKELICLYKVIKNHPQELFVAMKAHRKHHDADYYYRVRASAPKDKVGVAARFLYLNRTCWNGLYRVNLKGKFNVPIGTKDSVIFDTDDFEGLSKLLKRASIKHSDFEPIVDGCDAGDFLFLDPPYTTQHNYNGFIKYNEKIFSWEDQIRLRDSVFRAATRGVIIALTNADHSSIKKLYKGLGKYTRLHRQSVLAGIAEKRCPTTEALFLANVDN